MLNAIQYYVKAFIQFTNNNKSYLLYLMSKTFLLLFALLILIKADQPYRKVVHSTDPEAVCLDGTPPLLYYHEGVETNKFLIFFVGGGLCSGMTLQETTADCYARSKTYLGSSNGWPQTINGDGYLSTNSTISDFANWTKIIIGYCDGTLHQGYRKVPISYKGQKLYFKGSLITRSHFKWIMNRYPQFKNADQVIVTGSSAGGIATYLWTNYARTLVSNTSNVISIPDSGIFLITKTFETGIDYIQTAVINMFKLANIDEKTPLQLCNGKYKDEQYKCLFLQYAWTSLLARTMLVNSEYDSWVINNALRIQCLKNGTTQYTLFFCSEAQISFIEEYRSKFKQFLEYFLMNSKNSAWTIGCSQHGYSFDKNYFNSDTERVPTKTGPTIKQALNAFVFGKQRVHAEQTSPWPSNSGCAN